MFSCRNIMLFLLPAGMQFAACGQRHGYEQSQTFREMNQSNDNTTSAQADTERRLDTATFGTGCFWCTEAQFAQLRGVEKAEPGYSGGTLANPTYKEVCTGTTGHAEVVQITYDPFVITYDELLAAFWAAHDPTQLNRQGNDIGTQYRSAIFYHNEEQRRKAEEYKQRLNAEQVYDQPIVTEITPFTAFYRAEDYHHDYFSRNGNEPYCAMVVRPKVEKFKKVFQDKLKNPGK
jgi:peptide-methionine (S)-S-oxide reductase